MSKIITDGDKNIIRVGTPKGLPYIYIPFTNIELARQKYPTDTLYLFEPGVPTGYRIVAVPILMNKPEPKTDTGLSVDGDQSDGE